MLTMIVKTNHNDWEDHIPYLLISYHSTVQASTKCIPNILMFGREFHWNVDMVFGSRMGTRTFPD